VDTVLIGLCKSVSEYDPVFLWVCAVLFGYGYAMICGVSWLSAPFTMLLLFMAIWQAFVEKERTGTKSAADSAKKNEAAYKEKASDKMAENTNHWFSATLALSHIVKLKNRVQEALQKKKKDAKKKLEQVRKAKAEELLERRDRGPRAHYGSALRVLSKQRGGRFVAGERREALCQYKLSAIRSDYFG
jgi:flagellar biosynthesis component FlhA